MFAEDLRERRGLLRERIAGRRVLVIGGAGTIGSSFIRALLPYAPSALVVVDVDENGLAELTRDLRSRHGLTVPADYRTYPISFASPVFDRLLDDEPRFEIVANFAAHKHVRSEKDRYAIEAMIHNNVIAAERLLARLRQRLPERFFCVSTDKAANPVNVMGASKKLMEEVILAYADDMPVTTARFANVAFSNGSLLYGFHERIMRRQPLTAPSDVRRYFVSPEESGQLCLLACVCGEPGDIFYPRLSERQMTTFSTIADAYLRARGLAVEQHPTPHDARAAAERWIAGAPYPVHYFETDTSGEKSYEEFFTEEEIRDETTFRQLGVIRNAPRLSLAQARDHIAKLQAVFERRDVSKAEIITTLEELLPGFDHHETGKSLDQKM